MINSLLENENQESEDIQIGKMMSPKMESKEYNEFQAINLE